MLIKKQSLSDDVASKLREQIAAGNYRLNDKLPIEPDLMRSFGVGRSTVREAIKLLVNSGWLRVRQGLGTFVDSTTGAGEPMERRLGRAKYQDLDEVRELLEMKIAEKAAVHRSEDDIMQIRSFLRERKQAADHGLLEECIHADIRFHTAIADASGNEVLADLYKSTAILLTEWFRDVYKDTSAFKSTYHLHEQLLKNIVSGDAKKAWNTAAKIVGYGDR